MGFSSRARVTVFLPFPQTSTSVTRLRQPPHSVSMHAVSTPMASSAVSAVQDLHPHTSHITVRLRDPEPEHLHLAPHYACALGASRACLAPSSPRVCKDVSQSGLRMDRHRGVPFAALVIPSPSQLVLWAWHGPVLGPLSHSFPFIKFSIKTPILYFWPLPALFFSPKVGSTVC